MYEREQVIKWLNENGHAKVTSKILPLDNGHFRPVVEVIMGCLQQVKKCDLADVGGNEVELCDYCDKRPHTSLICDECLKDPNVHSA